MSEPSAWVARRSPGRCQAKLRGYHRRQGQARGNDSPLRGMIVNEVSNPNQFVGVCPRCQGVVKSAAVPYKKGFLVKNLCTRCTSVRKPAKPTGVSYEIS